MQKTLFLGNGINRLGNGNVSWNSILRELAETTNNRTLLGYEDFIPFSLMYEGFSLKSPENNPMSLSPLKKQVACLVKEMEPNFFHEWAMKSGVKHIITTNYDYCLEKSALADFRRKGLLRRRYSTFRKVQIGKVNVWHVHGEINHPDSIILGHEQYGGQLEHLRRYLTNRKKSKLISGTRNFDDDNGNYSWGEVFIRDDVHIVGFSLDYSEIDIWWILAFKAQYKIRYGIKCGNTHFYYWSREKKKRSDEAKIEILKSLNVNVESEFDIDYKNAYENFLKDFHG